MKRFSALAAAFVFFLATPSWAVEKTTITVNVDSLNCTTALGAGTFDAQTWSFGAAQSGGSTGGGGGAGKATVSGLKVTKNFDQCSPALFGGVTTGRHFRTVTVVQKDDKNATIMTVTLSDVIIASYDLSGSQTERNPLEAIVFNFTKLCINDSQSGTQACFDFASQIGN